MKAYITIFMCTLLFTLSNAQDINRCKDAEPPYINRMPGFFISDCKNSDFNEIELIYYVKGKANKINKGGKHYKLFYTKSNNENQKFSSAQINQNYHDAIIKVNGENLDDKKTTFSASINGKEVIMQVHTAANSTDTKSYSIDILEVASMNQNIVVSLEESINKNGKIAVYGILFDVGKSEIKPESNASLKQIIDYLSSNPDVKIYIVGHTDNTGTFAKNLLLSKKRAESIKKYLISTGNIVESRLVAEGVASLCPISTNDTEDGKKLNRRVEIVKQ